MVQITDMAKEKMQEVLEKHAGKHVRIFLSGMG